MGKRESFETMLLKGALHVHTTCSDGSMSIPEVVRTYENLGFDFIALTDHDWLLRPGCYEKQLSGLETGLIIFEGVELTVFEKGYVHVGRIEGNEEVLHVFNHPSKLDLPFDKVLSRITAVAETVPIDLVEITTNGYYTPEYDTPAIPCPRIATDDSHTPAGCGRAWIEMDCDRDKEKIIEALKRGEFWNCFKS